MVSGFRNRIYSLNVGWKCLPLTLCALRRVGWFGVVVVVVFFPREVSLSTGIGTRGVGKNFCRNAPLHMLKKSFFFCFFFPPYIYLFWGTPLVLEYVFHLNVFHRSLLFHWPNSSSEQQYGIMYGTLHFTEFGCVCPFHCYEIYFHKKAINGILVW